MAALERHLVPATNDTIVKDGSSKVGFVSDGVQQSQTDEGLKVIANHEDIELPEENDSDEDNEIVEIKQKYVLDAVFGDLAHKRKETEDDAQNKDDESRLGALEGIKRLKKAWLKKTYGMNFWCG